MNNKKFYEIVNPYFFRNPEIKFVYTIIRDYMLMKSGVEMPTPGQILEMVRLEDKDDMITKDILKSILKINMDQYSEKDFVIPRFNTWVLVNRLKTGTVDIIDETRDLDNIVDYDDALLATEKMKKIFAEMSSTNFTSDDNMGSDFDNPDHHIQDGSQFKVKSGFDTIDHMLGGGWDISTLNVIMAETSNGKCFFGDGKILVKNKLTGIKTYTGINKMFSNISKGVWTKEDGERVSKAVEQDIE